MDKEVLDEIRKHHNRALRTIEQFDNRRKRNDGNSNVFEGALSMEMFWKNWTMNFEKQHLASGEDLPSYLNFAEAEEKGLFTHENSTNHISFKFTEEGVAFFKGMLEL